MKFATWYEVAKYCEETFDSYVDWDEGYFICPECNEPIYWVDWIIWNRCPVCEASWGEY